MTDNQEVVLEAFTDFLNAVDAGITQARQTIKKAKGLTTKSQEGSWNPNVIEWQAANGAKGPYQKTVDSGNLQHKAMLADLENHDGKLRRDGFFYWLFSDKQTVGRKQK